MSKPVNKNINFMNTKLLLKKYRNIQLSINCRQLEIEDNALYYGLKKEDVKKAFKNVEDNEVTAQRIADINYSLINYMAICLDKMRTFDERGQRYYDYIYICYLSMEHYSAVEMYDHFGVNKTNFYKNLDKAIERLSLIMWGVGGIETDEFAELCKSFYSFAPAKLSKKEFLNCITNSVNAINCNKSTITDVVNKNTVEDPVNRELLVEAMVNGNTSSAVLDFCEEHCVALTDKDVKRIKSTVQSKMNELEDSLKELKKLQSKLFDIDMLIQ